MTQQVEADIAQHPTEERDDQLSIEAEGDLQDNFEDGDHGNITPLEPNPITENFAFDDNDSDSAEEDLPHNNEENAPREQLPDRSDHSFKELFSFLLKNGNYRDFRVRFSLGEILFLVLSVTLLHNMSLTATVDIMKMLNVICCTKLFPSSKFLFKKYFNPESGMNMHYTCEHCGNYLGLKKNKNGETEITMDCVECNTKNTMGGYRYNNSFITIDVVNQISDLLNDPSYKFTFNSPNDGDVLTDISSGSMFKRKIPNRVFGQAPATQFITCTFNSDGSPISKDGKTTITPIFLMINELDAKDRGKNLVLAGLWYGKIKPRMDVFLEAFTNQMNDLYTNGFSINKNGINKNFKVLTLCCCVDTVARAPMQGIKGVNGYYCCSWCTIKGKVGEVKPVKYACEQPTPAPRTEKGFLTSARKIVAGVKDVDILKGVTSGSPFLNMKMFSMIWGFIPDYMHLVILGVTDRFTDIWFANANFEGYIGSPAILSYMDSKIQNIKVPKFLKRLPVKITMRQVMKSKELENWFLFFSVPLLKGHLPRKFYNHWKLLVQAVRILLQDEVTHYEIDRAELLLLEFVTKTEKYYGHFEMTYNMHQLLHLAESVRRWGPLWSHTAYPFESSLGNLKSVLKATKGVAHQIVRNIEINRAVKHILNNHEISDTIYQCVESIQDFEALKAVKTDANETFLGYSCPFNENVTGLPINLIFNEFRKVVKNGVSYKIAKENNGKTDCSYVELDDGTFAQLANILCSVEEPKCSYVIINKLLIEEEPNITHIKRIIGRGAKFCCKLQSVKSVAVHISVDDFNDYICSIPLKHYAVNL